MLATMHFSKPVPPSLYTRQVLKSLSRRCNLSKRNVSSLLLYFRASTAMSHTATSVNWFIDSLTRIFRKYHCKVSGESQNHHADERFPPSLLRASARPLLPSPSLQCSPIHSHRPHSVRERDSFHPVLSLLPGCRSQD